MFDAIAWVESELSVQWKCHGVPRKPAAAQLADDLRTQEYDMQLAPDEILQAIAVAEAIAKQ
jgi:hypothetical protein